MFRLPKIASAIALAIAVSACGGGDKGTGPNPVPTYSAAITKAEISFDRTTFPEFVLLKVEGRGTKGNIPVTTGFLWKLDGNEVSTNATFEKPLVPGLYRLCLAVNDSHDVCQDINARIIPSKIAGRVVRNYPDPDDPSFALAMKVCARGVDKSSTKECVNADPLGNYSFNSWYQTEDSLVLSAECQVENCEYWPSAWRFSKAQLTQPQNFVVAHRNWTVSSGQWTGQTIDFVPSKAYVPGPANLSLFLRITGPSEGEYLYVLRTWKKERLPIPVALDPGCSVNATILQSDSTNLAHALSELNNELGDNHFRIANISEMSVSRVPGAIPRYNGGIGICVDPSVWPYGTTYVTTDAKYNDGGTVSVRSTNDKLDLKHELFHALGMGHVPIANEFWKSLMAARLSPSDPLYAKATKEDVGYYRIFEQVRELQLKYAAHGMAAIHQGELYLAGLPMENVYGSHPLTGIVQ
jgi:hypothetical protein